MDETEGSKENEEIMFQNLPFVSFVPFCLFLRRKFVAVRLVIAVPAAQSFVAVVLKEKLQRRRFDVAVAKDHVGFALVTGVTPFGAFGISKSMAMG